MRNSKANNLHIIFIFDFKRIVISVKQCQPATNSVKSCFWIFSGAIDRAFTFKYQCTAVHPKMKIDQRHIPVCRKDMIHKRQEQQWWSRAVVQIFIRFDRKRKIIATFLFKRQYFSQKANVGIEQNELTDAVVQLVTQYISQPEQNCRRFFAIAL